MAPGQLGCARLHITSSVIEKKEKEGSGFIVKILSDHNGGPKAVAEILSVTSHVSLWFQG